MFPYPLSGSLILGWSLGANNAATVFGTAVASHMIRFRTAALLTAAFVMLGAVVEGGAGIRTLSGLSGQTVASAMLLTLVVGLVVTLMTALKLPVSTSQGVVGAILGMALCLDPAGIHWGHLGKVVTCWVATPITAAVIAAALYPVLGIVMDRLPINMVTRSIVLKFALLISGSYGAYALGANNVANVTGVFYNTEMFKNVAHAETILTLIGGASIAVGVLTYSKKVMFTVGSDLVQLGAFSAWVAVLSEAITVHIYAVVGVPIPATQAIVGAVLGIGLARGIKTINRRTLTNIIAGWTFTPLAAGGLCYGLAWLTNLKQAAGH